MLRISRQEFFHLTSDGSRGVVMDWPKPHASLSRGRGREHIHLHQPRK
jgi:hypothetical protein